MDLHRTDTPQSSTGAVKPSVTDQAREKTNATAAEAQTKANVTATQAQLQAESVAQQAKGKTAGTVNNAEGKLENFKADMVAGRHRPHSHTQDAAATGQEQGAFLRTVGIPEEAGTASDAPGSATGNTTPLSSAQGITGPVAPTGQGGTMGPGSTGAEATQAGPDAGMSNTRKLAYNAADKAQEALASAKAKLVGGPGTST